MIDPDGFRPNVGIILSNEQRRLFWGRRIGQNAWQFPQGGIRSDETPLEAMYRELEEEVGLTPDKVTVLGCTQGWLRYRLPRRFIRRRCGPTCIGQKQVWFMLRVDCGEREFCLDRSAKPEFDAWRWVRYWYPLREVVYFKRHVYARALEELAPLLYPEGTPLLEGTERLPESSAEGRILADHEGPRRHAAQVRLAGSMSQRRR